MNLEVLKKKILLQWQKRSQREKQFLMITGGIVLSLGLLLGLIKPVIFGTLEKRREVASLQTKILKLYSTIKTYAQVVQAEFKGVDKAIMLEGKTKGAFPLFLEHLGHEQKRLGFGVFVVSMPNVAQPAKKTAPQVTQEELQRMAQSPPLSQGSGVAPLSFKKIQVEVRAKATYKDLGRFFEGLQNLPVLVNVSGLVIEKKDQSGKNATRISFEVISKDNV